MPTVRITDSWPRAAAQSGPLTARALRSSRQGEPKGAQIFALQLGVQGPPTQLTWLTEEPANLRWSPDGKWIGFTMRVPDAEKWTIDLPAAPEGATWAKTPRYTERLHTFRDQAGFTERGWRHLFLVASDGGAPRQVTSGNWNVGSRRI